MEYDLHRRKKLTSVLKASIYQVHDRLEFALITRDFLKLSQEQKRNPLHDDIRYGCPFKLRPVTTVWKVWYPSLEALEHERILERQRLENIDYQNKLAQEVEPELKRGAFLARRPLPLHVFRTLCTGSLWC
ncbi:uncharacterized protein C4orf36 homolog [Paroedura picta]|uniref:uncharacterized protein C4orf36 homolog n=1 Tax=Paroedura picta TaxID=143630 RepID=UPI004056DC5B